MTLLLFPVDVLKVTLTRDGLIRADASHPPRTDRSRFQSDRFRVSEINREPDLSIGFSGVDERTSVMQGKSTPAIDAAMKPNKALSDRFLCCQTSD